MYVATSARYIETTFATLGGTVLSTFKGWEIVTIHPLHGISISYQPVK